LHATAQVFSYLNLVAFAALGAVTIGHWRTRQEAAAAWAAASFGAIGLVVLLSRAVPEHPHTFLEKALQRIDIAALVVFPYLLFRFARAFARRRPLLDLYVGSLTTALVIWTFALPSVPAAGEPRPAWFVAYLVAFVVHWAVLSVVVSWRLWRAGRGEPTVARRRMWLLAAASVLITVAIIFAAASSGPDSAASVASGALAFASALAFWLGLAPPEVIRVSWRRPEAERVRRAIESLMTVATTQEEIAGRVLEPLAAIVGARAVAIRNEEGQVVGTHGSPEEGAAPLELGVPGGSLAVWTTPYAPFFGDEELQLLRTVGGLTGLALDRVRLFEREREARLALARTNAVMNEFVALAAHELRTPVTAIHGFVHTINRLGERLTAQQRRDLSEGLEQQSSRMVRLVGQLLDLSRLDAEVIEISPELFNVRRRVEEIVVGAAAGNAANVQIAVPHDLEAAADPTAFERILGNLVTNAVRYGEPPVIVTAERTDRHLRVAVEDRGPGVTPEFVPSLFDRFARGEDTRTLETGTGLGLAIARSYARAHHGDLLYVDAVPHGARFELVLPVPA
jgi:signal transduction histidine kinase